ncbi:MAG: hypothetical protein IPP48_13445 [Chitinophagaceae bacterium]|nr:hypothetical protein [Chitinophagaceae bacterium]
MVLGSVLISVLPASNGTITGSSKQNSCAGRGASINFTLNGTPTFAGQFRVREILNPTGPVFGATTLYSFTSAITGSQAQTIPGSLLPNASSVAKTYRVDWNSLTDGNTCNAFPLSGFVDITVNPLPIISVTAAPTADVCPGTNVTFTVTETNSIVGSNFKWEARDANNVLLGSASNVTFGTNAVNTNLNLTCPTSHVNPITFTFTPVGPGTLFCNGLAVTREVNIRDVVAPTIGTQASNSTVECDGNGNTSALAAWLSSNGGAAATDA